MDRPERLPNLSQRANIVSTRVKFEAIIGRNYYPIRENEI
jgi:hypothetical protein